MIFPNGRFIFEEESLYGGIHQGLPTHIRHYELLRNVRPLEDGTLINDRGIRKLSSNIMGGGSYDTWGGIDCQFSDGSQKLILFQNAAADSDAYLFVSADRSFTDQGVSMAQLRPTALMFANKLHTFDGSTMRTMDGSGTWATPGTADANACKVAAVYANRIIAGGDSGNPYRFILSGVRDASTWDLDLAESITNLSGEAINCIGTVGPFLVIGGRSWFQSYYRGMTTLTTWDSANMSRLTGPINQGSFCEAALRQGKGNYLAFFWAEDGPKMIAQLGNELPVVIGLEGPLYHFLRGEEQNGMPAIEVSRFTYVETAFFSEYDEIRFAFSLDGDTRNKALLCLNVSSALAFAKDQDRTYPIFRLRDNQTSGLPVSCLFSCQVNSSTGLPSTSGRRKNFSAYNGVVYELDADNATDDNGTPIPIELIRTGYSGHEEKVRSIDKSFEHVNITASVPGSYTLYADLEVDGGLSSDTDEVDLSGDLSLWSDLTEDGTWGDGGLWMDADYLNHRLEFDTVGKVAKLRIYDNGNIRGSLTIDPWVIEGALEDRNA